MRSFSSSNHSGNLLHPVLGCSQTIPCLFPGRSPAVLRLFPAYSLAAPQLFSGCYPVFHRLLPWLFPGCSQFQDCSQAVHRLFPVPRLLPGCSQALPSDVPSLFLGFSQTVPCSQTVPRLFPDCSQAPLACTDTLQVLLSSSCSDWSGQGRGWESSRRGPSSPCTRLSLHPWGSSSSPPRPDLVGWREGG